MRKQNVIVFLILLLFTGFIFRSYILHNTVPLPFNLLVSSFSPWKYEDQYRYVANKPLGFDNLKLFFPFRKFTTEELKQGTIPLWNPYVFSGNVHLASYQAAVFYPPSLLYMFFPLADAWSILVLMQPVVCGLFTFLFLRSLHRSFFASVLGAFGFAFCGWMIANWEEVLVQVHTIMYLPLALYASNLIWKRNYLVGSLLLVIALSFSTFAGFLQMSMYLVATVLLWNLAWLFTLGQSKRHISTIAVLFGCLLVTAGITALQWIPGLEAYLFSPRGVVDSKFLFDEFLSPLYFLLTFLIPDFWGNPGTYNYFSTVRFINERTIWIPFPILLLGTFVLFIRGNGVHTSVPSVFFWKLFTLVTYALGFALPISWIFYLLRIPILSAANPARIFVLAAFGISVLAAYGFDTYLSSQKKKLIRIFLPVSFVFAGAAAFLFLLSVVLFVTRTPALLCHAFKTVSLLANCNPYHIPLYLSVTLRNIVLPLGGVVVLWGFLRVFGYNKIILLFCSVVLLAGTVTYQAEKMVYFSQRSHEFPMVPVLEAVRAIAGIDRVMSIGEGHILRNMLSYYRIQSADGYDALFSQRYGELLYTLRNKGNFQKQITRTDADIPPPGQGERISSNPYRLRIMKLLGVKYVLETKEVNPLLPVVSMPADQFPLIWEDAHWRMFTYRDALPRAFLANTARIESDRKRQIELLYDPQLDLATTILLDALPQGYQADDSGFLHLGPDDGKVPKIVTVESYEPTTVRLTTSSSTDQFLFLSDTNLPGWKATVDNTAVPILNANYAFRAIIVPAGDHRITFWYDPVSWNISKGVFMTSVVVFGGLMAYLYFAKRR